MKVRPIWLAMVAALAMGLGGCTIPPKNPNPGPNGDMGDSRPEGVPADWPGVRFHFEGHNNEDFPKVISFRFTLTAVAINPQLIGAFVDPDSGVNYPLRDPATRLPIPVTLDRATPYGATLWYPPGEQINFTINYQFYGEYGDAVICDWQTPEGINLPLTRSVAKQYDIPKPPPFGLSALKQGACTPYSTL
ncbi:MAG TPA: hypothetical protein VIY48_11790 [Candidatus Paceibacterota bacterium]